MLCLCLQTRWATLLRSLCLRCASAITGVTLYVDNGVHAMGVAVDSPAISAAANVAPPAPTPVSAST